MAFDTDILHQEFLHTLHSLLVFHFGESVFHGVGSVEVGEIEFAGFVGGLGFEEDVLLHGGPVIDDIFLFVSEFAERHVRAHAHGAAHVGHQRPHEAVPRRDGSLVDGERLVGHEGALVNGTHHAGASAAAARTLAVEG